MNITNDNEFKSALAGLNIGQKRKVAAAFVESVLPLCSDIRVTTVITIAKRDDVTDSELAAAYQLANTARVASFCNCGQEIDWQIQTTHFIARGAMDCVKPATESSNLAWDAATDIRIARTCHGITSGEPNEQEREAQIQYRILGDFLN